MNDFHGLSGILPERMHRLLDLSERVFICKLAKNGRVLACSDSLRKILEEPDAPVGRNFTELFLPATGAGKKIFLSEIIAPGDASPLLVRMAMSNRPCRLLACAEDETVICWGEVIGDLHTTGLNEISALAGQIQTLLSRVKQQHDELQQGLKAATWLQKRFLPEEKLFAGVRTAWQFRPCESVGGDYFNVFTRKDGRVAAYIIDVSGHGVAPAMMGVAVVQSLQQMVTSLDSSDQTANDMSVLIAKLEQEFPFERFDLYFSMIYLEIGRDGQTVQWVNAGHPEPIFARQGQAPEMLKGGRPFIGLDSSGPTEVQTLKLRVGDRIYLYSDGITERRNQAGEFFGKTRLLENLVYDRYESLQQSVEYIVCQNDDFASHSAAQDDLTLVGLEIR